MAAESFSSAPEQQSTVSDCSDHLLYSAFQKPVTAMAQAVDKLANTNFVESTKFLDAPQQAEFGSARWHAEQIASGVGSFVPFVGSMAIAKPLLRPLQAPLLETFGNLPAQTLLSRYALGEAATAGFIQGSVFEPSHSDDSFLSSRFKQGITGATTMTVLHASSNALGRFTGASEAEAGIIRKALTTGIAGTGAGATSYLADTAINGRSFNVKEFAQTAYTMGFTGAALGAGADGFMRLNMPKSNLPSVDEYVARNYDGKIASNHYVGWLAKQSLEGKTNLLSKWISDRMSKRQPEGENENSLAGDLKLSDYAPLDRLALVNKMQRLANTEMISAKALDSLITKLQNASEKFDKIDIAPLYEKLDAAQAKVEKRMEAQEKAKDWGLDHRLRPIITHGEDGSFSAHYPEHRRVVKAERRFQTALAERRIAKQELDAVLNPRLEKMNEAINDWLNEQSLPSVKVKAGWVNGSASYGMGELTISPELLNTSKINTTQMSLILHELVHHKQETLAVRLLADQMGLGKEPTSEQMKELQQRMLYETAPRDRSADKWSERTDLEETSTHITDILRYRDGVELTPTEAKQARRFLNAQSEYTSPPWKRRADEFRNRALEIENLEIGLSEYDLQRFLKEISDDPGSVKDKYGFKKIPDELVKMAAEAATKRAEFESDNHDSPWDRSDAIETIRPDRATVERAKELLKEQLKKNEATHGKYNKWDYDWYMNSALERQAYPAGIAAFLFAQAKLQSQGGGTVKPNY